MPDTVKSLHLVLSLLSLCECQRIKPCNASNCLKLPPPTQHTLMPDAHPPRTCTTRAAGEERCIGWTEPEYRVEEENQRNPKNIWLYTLDVVQQYEAICEV
ncbi:hypothetical protein B0H10DRAFT_1966599 [Mycena sp. CBHHK59/15]|nr:hypothetical protein B0H10DRAFT_1966599 [Mycena sp. CBHHK59/15]